MTHHKKDNENPTQPGEQKASSRRAFLKFGALGGAMGLLGALPVIAAGSEQDGSDAEPLPEGEETIRLLNQDGELVEVKKTACKAPHGKLVTDPDKVRQGVKGKRFVMVVDLASCRNARKCVESCQKTHSLMPHQEYLNVKKMQDNEAAGPYWMPQLCFQCDNPPCTKVCPVGATFKREDGVVAVDVQSCIGCRFCMAACPYNARIFEWSEPEKLQDPPAYSPETSLPRKMGTVSKCDFCVDMVRDGGLPHCVTDCPNGVFYFGDENEDVVTNGSQTVRLSKLLEERAGYRYMEGLGTKPRVYYLPPRNREFPFETGEENYEKAQDKMKDYRLELNPNGEDQ